MNEPITNKSKRKGKPRFRVTPFNPETDNCISYLQVVYGEYKNNFPVIMRFWVYENYWFAAPKEAETRPAAWRYDDACNKRVCGTVRWQKRSKLELQIIEKVKDREFRFAWNRLTGWNYFVKKPSKTEMEFYILCKMKGYTKRKGH